MNATMEVLFGLLGGLAIFIFGMNLMSECLQKAAGEKMKAILALLTKNPVLGVVAGALTTAVLQSSSATTVMAIGFVSAGLMKLPQAISIILGANIGTTITAQIIAFKISDYIYVFVFVGFFIAFLAKTEKLKNIGQTIFAFGLLFLGIETMGGVMKPLAGSAVFTDMIGRVANTPILGVGVGTLMTLVVQSSSATIAVLQNFASQAAADGTSSIIGLTGAIPILLGDNIGTTITAVLASVGQTKDAKRTAVAHCVFNVSGSVLFVLFVKPYAQLIQLISPKGAEVDVIARQIANAHTGFNLVMTLIWIPLIWLLVKIVMIIVPDGKGEKLDDANPQFLDDKLMGQPAAALQLVAKEVIHMSRLVESILQKLANATEKSKEKQMEHIKDEVLVVQGLNSRITEYLSDLFAAGVLTEEQANKTAGMLYVLSDVDRLAVLCGDMVTILGAKGGHSGKEGFSKDALKDINKSLTMIAEMYSESVAGMERGDIENVNRLIKRRQKVMELNLKMRKRHMQRVNEGSCKAELTASFNQLLYNIDRMSNSCVNIADAVMGSMDLRYFIGETQEDL